MPEYIEREKFRKFAMEMTDSNEVKFEYCYPYWQFNKAINESPAADVEEVRHGKWIEKPFLLGTGRFCSSCGNNYGMPHEVFNYCPNCGAKMDLEG